MLFKKIDEQLIAALKQRIIELTFRSRAHRQKAKTLSGEATKSGGWYPCYTASPKWQEQEEARCLGWEARHIQLAYGLLRGKRYRQIEAHTRPDHKPRAYKIVEAIHEAASAVAVPGFDKLIAAAYTQKYVEQWLQFELGTKREKRLRRERDAA